jgi:L-ascorbate metabolism protein UlaG (beta-lactamase superfamily)
MGPEDAVEAIKLIRPKCAVPAHYNTWPPIEQDVSTWAEMIKEHTSAEPIVLEPGGSFSL